MLLLLAAPAAAQNAASTSSHGHGHSHQPPPPPPPPPPPVLTLTFAPQMPSILASIPLGTVVATATAAWSDGSAFTGTLSMSNNDGGTFALSCSTCAMANIVIDPVGPGVGSDGGTVQMITVVATQ